MGCNVEGRRQQGASRDAMEIVRKTESGAVNVAKFVGVTPVLPLRQQRVNIQQQRQKLTPQQQLEKLPPCLRKQFRRGQRERQQCILFDNGEGKPMPVLFEPDTVSEPPPRRHVNVADTSQAHSPIHNQQHTTGASDSSEGGFADVSQPEHLAPTAKEPPQTNHSVSGVVIDASRPEHLFVSNSPQPTQHDCSTGGASADVSRPEHLAIGASQPEHHMHVLPPHWGSLLLISSHYGTFRLISSMDYRHLGSIRVNQWLVTQKNSTA